MGRAEQEWATRNRRELLELFGNVRAHCGTDENLDFDCVPPRGHKHHRGDASQRMCFYRRQLLEGNLQVLCMACNAREGDEPPSFVLTAPLEGGEAELSENGGEWRIES
jgi:hypothetical protein